ncbi:hypothetical protein [Aminobacter aminovorans]|uniref:hypothetical protein n=1 Tax=Aminobacter aminovorans TaxID=83263 RepID=UPI002855867F|nr:hypothetical protein [Aminobacter aminovorans]MDR7220365.1 hypothetical protein [Aminobacter aminovorans]
MGVLLNPYRFKAAIAPAFVSYIGTASGSTGSNIPINIGSAFPGREVFIFLVGTSAGATLTSATIGGVPAKIHVQRTGPWTSSTATAALISAPVPAGTSVNVVPTFSISGLTMYLHSWAVGNLVSDTAIATASQAVNNLTTATMSIATVPDGLVLGGAGTYSAAGTNFGNWTRDYLDQVGSTFIRRVGGHALTTATEARSITITDARGVSGSFQGPCLAASFR